MPQVGNQEDPLDEVRAAVREDRLKFERLPVASLQLKSRSGNDSYGRSQHARSAGDRRPGHSARG